MTQSYSVSLEKIIAAHNLEIIYLPKPADEILITTNEVNRPGIVMTGYTDYFDAERVQILGWTEFGFLLIWSRKNGAGHSNIGWHCTRLRLW